MLTSHIGPWFTLGRKRGNKIVKQEEGITYYTRKPNTDEIDVVDIE